MSVLTLDTCTCLASVEKDCPGYPKEIKKRGAIGPAVAGGDDDDPGLDCPPVADGQLDLCLKPVA